MPVTTHNHQDRRREIAAINQAEREGRTAAEQLDLLVERGHGHCDEAFVLWSGLPGVNPETDNFPYGG